MCERERERERVRERESEREGERKREKKEKDMGELGRRDMERGCREGIEQKKEGYTITKIMIMMIAIKCIIFLTVI